MKLCLGTVQFGMKYGIANQIGRQPTWEESFAMLDEAVSSGIDTIDTARAYGEAELVLGEWLKNNPENKQLNFISKLRPNVIDETASDIEGIVEKEICDTLHRLDIIKLDGYLLHTPEYIYRSDIVAALVHMKERGFTDHIGISIYDIKEGEAALDTGVIEYLQMPYSILDQRGVKEQFLKKCKDKGVITYTRSAFLQGLILMKEDSIPSNLENVKPYMHKLDQILSKYDIDNTMAVLQFVKAHEDIDYLVFGVETVNQLKEDIYRFNEGIMPEECVKEIEDSIGRIDDSVIFPSLWSNGRKAE